MAKLEITGFSLKYKSTDTVILDNADAVFSSGDVILLTGENGTGKSTLLKSLLRMEMRDKMASGKILFSGVDIMKLDNNALQTQRRKIAYLQQQDNYDALDGYTVADILYDSYEAKIGRKLSKTDRSIVEGIFNRYIPEGTKISLKSKIQKLSGGQKRLISIIADICLFADMDFYFIDEPLNNLDMKTVRQISNLLNKIHLENPGAIIVMVSHCKIFPFINRVFKIEHGKLLEDSSTPVCNTCFGLPNENGFYKV